MNYMGFRYVQIQTCCAINSIEKQLVFRLFYRVYYRKFLIFRRRWRQSEKNNSRFVNYQWTNVASVSIGRRIEDILIIGAKKNGFTNIRDHTTLDNCKFKLNVTTGHNFSIFDYFFQNNFPDQILTFPVFHSSKLYHNSRQHFHRVCWVRVFQWILIDLVPFSPTSLKYSYSRTFIRKWNWIVSESLWCNYRRKVQPTKTLRVVVVYIKSTRRQENKKKVLAKLV